MNDSELRDWLRDTDAAFASHDSPAPDAETCRRVLARRTRRRRMVAVSTMIVGCIAGATALYMADRGRPPIATNSGPPTSDGNISATDPHLDEQQIAALLREADAYAQKAAEHERMVSLLREAERLVELEQELAELDASASEPLPPTVRVQEEINRVAATQLVIAKRLRIDYADNELAADVYREVAAEFPETRWAATALESLAQLNRSM